MTEMPMKRMPVVVSFVLFLGLCASIAYWVLQLMRPPVRPMAPPPPPPVAETRLDAVAGLFGGRPAAMAVASNYQLKGVVVAANGRESVAILSADGKPAQAVGVSAELQPGVTVREVHSQYVLLSEGGIIKRVGLPEGVRATQQADFTTGALPPLAPLAPPPQIATPLVNQVPPPGPAPSASPAQVPPPIPTRGIGVMGSPGTGPIARPVQPPPGQQQPGPANEAGTALSPNAGGLTR